MFQAFFFRRPATPESAATCSLPRGGGLGRGHSPNFGNLSQYLHHPNTSLAACCPLSNSLPQGERTEWLLELRVLQGKQVVQAVFYFSDDLKSTVVNPSKPSPACRACAVRTHAFFIFPVTPTHRVRALWYIPYRWVQRSSEKISRRLFHLPCDKGCLKNSCC